MNFAPCFASKIKLLINTLVSNRFFAGRPELSGYDKRSPPTAILTLLGSIFYDLWSRTNVA